MRRIIAQLLIVAVLATNVAWAADNCFSFSAGSAPVLEQLDSGQDSGGCDDFCVGWLHLHSIAADAGHADFVPTRQTVALTDVFFDSHDQSPPLRPPQI